MAMPTLQRTIDKLIKQAERYLDLQDWDEAAARCYRVLALDCTSAEAHTTLLRIYQQPDLAADMRPALQRLFPPEEASPHQFRRKLAFSYRVLSRWRGWRQDDFELPPPVDVLEEVAQQLDHAYVSGQDSHLPMAWELYREACARRPDHRRAIHWWMARQYARRGFFADAAEVLTEMHGLYPDDLEICYLLAEMRWWRDQAEQLNWIS